MALTTNTTFAVCCCNVGECRSGEFNLQALDSKTFVFRNVNVLGNCTKQDIKIKQRILILTSRL